MSKHWHQRSEGGARWNPEKAVCAFCHRYPYPDKMGKWFRSPEMWGQH